MSHTTTLRNVGRGLGILRQSRLTLWLLLLAAVTLERASAEGLNTGFDDKYWKRARAAKGIADPAPTTEHDKSAAPAADVAGSANPAQQTAASVAAPSSGSPEVCAALAKELSSSRCMYSETCSKVMGRCDADQSKCSSAACLADLKTGKGKDGKQSRDAKEDKDGKGDKDSKREYASGKKNEGRRGWRARLAERRKRLREARSKGDRLKRGLEERKSRLAAVQSENSKVKSKVASLVDAAKKLRRSGRKDRAAKEQASRIKAEIVHTKALLQGVDQKVAVEKSKIDEIKVNQENIKSEVKEADAEVKAAEKDVAESPGNTAPVAMIGKESKGDGSAVGGGSDQVSGTDVREAKAELQGASEVASKVNADVATQDAQVRESIADVEKEKRDLADAEAAVNQVADAPVLPQSGAVSTEVQSVAGSDVSAETAHKVAADAAVPTVSPGLIDQVSRVVETAVPGQCQARFTASTQFNADFPSPGIYRYQITLQVDEQPGDRLVGEGQVSIAGRGIQQSITASATVDTRGSALVRGRFKIGWTQPYGVPRSLTEFVYDCRSR